MLQYVYTVIVILNKFKLTYDSNKTLDLVGNVILATEWIWAAWKKIPEQELQHQYPEWHTSW